MTIHYVDSNASGLNDGTSWTDAYADLATAVAGNVIADDTIYVASDHSKVYTATVFMDLPNNIKCYSVNSTSGEYEIGAYESTSSAFQDYILYADNIFSFSGFELSPAGDANLGSDVGGSLQTYKDIVVSPLDTSFELWLASTVGGKIKIDGLIFNTSGTENTIYVERASVYINNMSGTSSLSDVLLSYSSGDGGAVYISNSNIASILATNGSLIDDFISTSGRIEATFYRCKLPSGYSVFNSAPVALAYNVSLIECDTGDGYHYFYHGSFEGEIQEDTTTYLSATYDGTNGFSAELSTSANASIDNPLRHKLLSIPASDLTTSIDITINLLTDNVTLTDTGLFLEAVHNDNTDLALGVTVSTRNSDILATGTNLTTNTEAWTETLGTPVKQEVTVTIPALSNVDNGVVDIYVNLTLASTTVWACPEYVVT